VGRTEGREWGWVGRLFWSVDNPLPLFEVEVPPCGHRVPGKEAFPLEEGAEGENLHPPPIQLVRHRVIRCDGDDDRFPPVGGQLDIRIKHPRSRTLRKIVQSPSGGSGVVEDVVTVDVGSCAFETFAGAPFEEFVFVD